eukprot:TRINITY_DN4554_c0_g1_i1.p1 TRINITY_DN4554_c0_g1~~TRINITY_DN4554_c0_g1_i1.p1  ORF type:complete len:255 (-),score=34.03 TRINITY_DN4554_c0_g1_i1:16-780(-)
MKPVLFVVFAFLLCATAVKVRQSKWVLIWSDDFDGTKLDTTKWSTLDQNSPRNNELEYYTSEDVYVENSNLVLRSQKRPYKGAQYTSGLVNSTGKFSHTYGRWEVRAKLPYGDGLWPAHWLLPENSCWPVNGEIDIMENLGQDVHSIYGHVHVGERCDQEISQGAAYVKTNIDFSQDYHIYEVEWTSTYIKFFVDGVNYVTATNEGGKYPIPSKPMYWILNTAIGGSWPKPPDSTTKWPQYHYIDYVKVWQQVN